MTKKIVFFSAIFLLAFSLVACTPKKPMVDNVNQSQADGVKETGSVIDASDKNGQTIAAKIGDVIYFKLTGQAASGNQWTVVKPVSGDAILLKDHRATDINNPQAPNGEFTDEWWIKIEKSGTIEMQFDYGVSGKKSTKSFKLTIDSQ